MEAELKIQPVFLFLMRGDHHHPTIWQDYFDEAGKAPRIWIHAKEPGAIRSGLFRKAERVPTLSTEWGGISLVRATLRLLEAALGDGGTTHFMLLSESCVPVKPMIEITRRLELDPRSRIAWQGPEDMALFHRRRAADAGEVDPGHWRLHPQWLTLDRETAEWILREDHTARFEKVFAPDEHYFGTVLAMAGYALAERVKNAATTWSEWRDNRLTTWERTPASLALELYESPAFFARKFAPCSDIGKWRLHLPENRLVPVARPRRAAAPPRQPSNILVAVISGRGREDARQVCRETWAAGPPAGVAVRFFAAGGSCVSSEPDVMDCQAPQENLQVPPLSECLFARILANQDANWVFLCDDLTYVDLERLAGLPAPETDVLCDGSLWEKGAPNGRAGVLFSKRAAEALARDGVTIPLDDGRGAWFRDVARLGLNIRASDLLRATAKPYPRSDNDLVTAHCGDPAQMRATHSLRTNLPVLELRAEHAGWRDLLFVLADGYFARKTGYCAGKLERDHLGLILRWLDWKAERLEECNGEEWADYRVKEWRESAAGADRLLEAGARHRPAAGQAGSREWGVHTVYLARENLPYLEEWLQWHLALGASYFHLYDNTGSTTQELGNSLEVNGLTKYGYRLDMSLTDDEVKDIESGIFKKFPVSKTQWQPLENGRIVCGHIAACDHFSSLVRNGWCAFIDIDEFLLPEGDVVDHLNPSSGAIRVLQKKFADRSSYARVLECTRTFSINTRGWAPKLIMNMDCYVRGKSPHIHALASSRPVRNIAPDVLRFNHFNHGPAGHAWLLANSHWIDPEWVAKPFGEVFDERCERAARLATKRMDIGGFVPVPMARPMLAET